MTMKVNLDNNPIFQGCYDADEYQWDLYVRETDLDSFPRQLLLAQYDDMYWNCYLDKVIWDADSFMYHLIYKEY